MKKPIQFGKYYLLDRVNVGGMAEVFKAKAFGVEGFERLVAVKRILPNIAEDEEFITMFIDEAKIAVQLNHANICQIFDLGNADGSYFIALEFVHGKDLRAIFDCCRRDGAAMPIAQACFIIMKACEGLDYAHNKRDAQGRELHLVHRDVSPQNVLISYEGEIKLIDFGIAKAAGKASKTQQGILKGKFGYMSPEQVRGLPLDRRSDVFSLGIVLYELLTGERLFVGESDFSTLEKVRNVEILPPSTYNRRIADELERIVFKALAKDVEDRYQNAIDLHDDLQAFMYTAGEFYSRKDLAAWMKRIFAAELEAETAKLDAYREIVAPPAHAERPRRMSGPNPVVASLSNRGQVVGRISGSHPTVKPAAVARRGVEWDEEELATSIYDGATDAADSVVQDDPDLSRSNQFDTAMYTVEIEAPRTGEIEALHTGEIEALRTETVELVAPETLEMAAPKTVELELPKARELMSGRQSGPVSLGRVGAFDFAVPVSGARPFEPPVTGPSRRMDRGRLLKWVGASLLALSVGFVSYGIFRPDRGKSGQIVITSEPASDVQILVDNQRMNIDGTPAMLELDPGFYTITVQRDGYVPWREEVEIKPGSKIARRALLEPLAAGTGFTLLSEPAGAQVILDGHPLDGRTPLKVQSVAPGRHRLEVRGTTGVWSQEVTLEAGRMLDLHAKLASALRETAPVKPVAPPRSSSARADSAHSDAKAGEHADSASASANRPARSLPRLPPLMEETPKEPAKEPVAVKEPRANAPVSEEGTLRLGSKPWTNIAIDGKETGLHTPQTALKLSAGTHRVTLSNAEFNIHENFSVEIRPGETKTITKNLRTQTSDSD